MIKKLLFFFWLLPLWIFSQSSPDKPSNYVTDDAGVLDPEELNQLNAKCKSYEDSTSNQIFVYVCPSLNGDQIEEFSTALFNKWVIGQEGKDNGLLITVFVNDHNFRITTGYGMEGSLPDLLTKKIQDETMKPFFRDGNYYNGLSEGIDKLAYYSAHEFVPEEESKAPLVIFIVVFLLAAYAFNALFLWATRSAIKESTKRSDKAKRIARVFANCFFYIPFLGTFLMIPIMMIFSKFKTGGTGSGSSRSWGGSSGSSFGGGGGGRSGGGGSSSSW